MVLINFVMTMMLHTFAFLVLNIAALHSPVSFLHVGRFSFKFTVVHRQRSVRHTNSGFVTVTVKKKHVNVVDSCISYYEVHIRGIG